MTTVLVLITGVLAGVWLSPAARAAITPAGPGDPSLQAEVNITGRTIPSDQFTVTITDPSNASVSGTTAGSGTGLHAGPGEVAGPILAAPGTSYHVAETSSSGDLGEYTVSYSCIDTADPAQRSVASGTGAAFDLTFPAAVAGETNPFVVCTFTDVANPIAGQGSLLDCSGGTLYDVAKTQVEDPNLPGQLDAITTASLSDPSGQATVSRIATVPNGGAINALGITRGGTAAYMVDQYARSASTTVVHMYNPLSQTWSTFTGSAQPNAVFVAGAVNPRTGIYYYADFSGQTATLFGFDTATNTAIPGIIGTFPLPVAAPANGDIAFDAIGNLYVLASSGLNGAMSVVSGPLPTTGADTPLTAVLLNTYTLANTNAEYNGIAFDNMGRLYIQHLSAAGTAGIITINPNTGAQFGAESIESTDGLNPRVDLGACSANPVMELQKVVNSRANASDEFNLSITGGGVTAGNTATTVGSAPGLQVNPDGTVTNAGPVVGVQGTTYTFTETGASGADLADYTTTYRCLDINAPGQPVVASGTGASFQLVFPGAVPGETGPAIICTFTNTAKPTLELDKVLGGARVSVGDQFTMQIHTGSPTGPVISPAANSTTTGSGSTVDPGTGTTGPVFVDPGTTYYLTEAAANGADLSFYSQTISCVDANGVQPNLPRNAPFSGSFALTPVAGSDISCTLTNNPLSPNLVVTKSVDPASTTPVNQGDTLTYTLTFDNTSGQAPASVNWTDYLSKVLDDATVISNPALATGSGLTVSPISNGSFAVTGTLGVNAKATVTYQVQVDVPDTGDHQLDNFIVPTGDTPPPSCLPTDPDCTTNPVPDLVVTKFSAPISTATVQQGQLVTYTLSFDNSGGKAPASVNWTDDLSKVLDDATVVASPTATGALLAGPINGGAFTITGTVAAGQSATVTYQVRVDSPDAGDHQLDNYVVPTGTTPPPSCLPTNPDCTTNPVPDLVVSKSVDPASTTPVNPGDVLTYTLTFSNAQGKAPADVDYVDDLSKVLDDAAVVTQPGVASGAGLTVGNIVAGQFTVAGQVQPGQSTTVTYQVRVADPDNGDHQLDNFLVPTGTTPPPSCQPSNSLCTTNPVPDLVVTKDASPASTTAVNEGDTIVYQLTFDNSAGKAPASVDWTDDLTKVLDDATVTSDPTGSAGLVIGPITGGTFEITGTVAAGATSTVLYRVQVDSPDTGDHQLDNFVVPTGTTPPPSCLPTNPDCTTHPVPDLVVTKDASPVSTTAVNEGDAIVYQLSFDNSDGKAPASVDWTDDLSKVLDDATITSNPTASGAALVLGPITNGSFQITGTVAAGAVATVIYHVQVDSPDTGDHRLDNFLVPTGTTPPPTCLATNALCTTHPVPDLVVSKSVDPSSTTPVNPGQTLTYSLVFDNTAGQAPASVNYDDELSQVLDDATVTSDPSVASGSGLTVGSISGGRFTITGQVPAGERTVVTYQATVDDPDGGNHRLDNFLVPSGSTPPPTCVASNPLCTTNPVPDLVVTKSVDPSSTTAVTVGQTLTYTLTFDNSLGQSDAAVNYTDEMAKVLDDATITTDPALATGMGLTVGAVTGTTFTVTGTLAAGTTATVTYQVQVDSPDTGDHRLDNFLVPTGSTPPPTCEPANQLCTTNPDPDLKVTKTVDPPSGSQVHPGDVLTYTLTFDNSDGKADAPVAWHDDLSDLLDDATIVSEPVLASGSGLTIGAINDAGVFEIDGSLPAGTTATVTYQARIDDPDHGNGRLNNYLEPIDTPTPPGCVNSLLCTINELVPPPPTTAFTGVLVSPLTALGVGSALLALGVLLTLAGRRRRTGETG